MGGCSPIVRYQSIHWNLYDYSRGPRIKICQTLLFDIMCHHLASEILITGYAYLLLLFCEYSCSHWVLTHLCISVRIVGKQFMSKWEWWISGDDDEMVGLWLSFSKIKDFRFAFRFSIIQTQSFIFHGLSYVFQFR